MDKIRNFVIIAHIDHGKSTLADRMLEVTGTVEKSKLKEQMLDSMDLERERGITIKMKPVRMSYQFQGDEYILNLIDTPGHVDFSYEVSRALRAVEGAILLVDATQGVQAQTLTVLETAKNLNLKIIPALSKIDSPLALTEEVKEEVSKLLNCDKADIIETSGKTGEGVHRVLEEVIKKISPPQRDGDSDFRSLVFDFQYSNHKGVIVFVRVMDGSVSRGDELVFKASGRKFNALEVGIFTPSEVSRGTLPQGTIGYIVTGIKEPGVAAVGDTVSLSQSKSKALSGYMNPKPIIWASVFPESQDDFVSLRQALDKLKLSDSSLSFEEETSGVLGRGFRCGFLGMLHLEVATERLRREFNLELVVTTPSVNYRVLYKNGKEETIYSPNFFPEDHLVEKIFEPWCEITIMVPSKYLGNTMQLLFEHEAEIGNSETFGDNRVRISANMPLRELMRNFFDRMKSVSSGFASISYEISGLREAFVTKIDILIAEEPVLAFARIVAKHQVQEESEKIVEKLYNILPKQLFLTKIQAKALGRIVASRTLSALKKDVTAHMYGGDITRKMKLREKQKKGKKKMKERGKVNIPHEIFLKIMRSDKN